MPKGVPRLGQSVIDAARTSSAGELTEAPGLKDLGTLDLDKFRTKSFEENGPPPWEVDPRWTADNTNARKFVEVPDTWELRWLNPRHVDVTGMRDWQTVPAIGDTRVVVKNRSMVAADNTIRRGGHQGDFLAFMPKHWVESRKRLKAETVRRRTQSAVDRQQQTVEEVKRGNYGPYVSVDNVVHPTHTIGDGKTMTD